MGVMLGALIIVTVVQDCYSDECYSDDIINVLRQERMYVLKLSDRCFTEAVC